MPPQQSDEPKGEDVTETIAQGGVSETVIGPYHLLELIGHGGMGEVWLAEQRETVRRRVAIKLIKAGMDTREVVARFGTERQALALMDHPAIAKVFDAGSTPQGRPYFVMEYVAGARITDYCDQRKMTLRQRLELFIQVCDGVQHAHQKAIIHRDLKPSNILVGEVDGKPAPRIIDFGLAKATAQRLTDDTVYTRLGAILGTPTYMSPEQADSSGVDVDTRTDVYSLGVVLYELLVGALPLEFHQLALDKLLRRLREEEAPRPSTKVRSLGELSAVASQNRGVDPQALVRQLCGDLDAILLKALEKDRARRYATPSDLAADLGRYLRHEPVLAHPPSTAYRLRKYVRRHRIGVTVAAAMVVLLVSFAVAQAFELRRITRERDRADRISAFMADMFKVSDPNEARGSSVTAREILDKASKEIDTGLAKDPEVQSQMMQVMATTYSNLGLYSHARELASRAVDARSKLLGPHHPTTLESQSLLAWILGEQGHFSEAEKMERVVLADDRRVFPPEDAHTLDTMDRLADILQRHGTYDEAEKLLLQVMQISTRKFGPESPRRLRTMVLLSSTSWLQGRYAEAEQEYRQLVDADIRMFGSDSPDTLSSKANLAMTVSSEGRPAEAEPLYRDVVAGLQRVMGPEHRSTVVAMVGLAHALNKEGKRDEAENLLREALAIRLKTLGPEHRETLLSQLDLENLLVAGGHFSEAEELQRKTLEIQNRVLGPEKPDTLVSWSNLAAILNREGRFADAESVARKNLAVETRVLGPQHPYTVYTLQQLGTALASSHRYAEAVALFQDAIAKDSNPARKGTRFAVWYSFACVAAAADRPDDALRYLREAVNRGYKDGDGLTTDDDLKNLRPNPAFQQLVASLKTTAGGR